MRSAAPLRIVHVAATPSGAPWMVALLREQKGLGHDVAAIIPAGDGDIGVQLQALGIPYHVAGVDILFAVPTLHGKIATLYRLTRMLRRLRPDVVHSHIINSVTTSRLASWLADVPIHLGGNVHPFSMESEILRPIETGTAFCDTVTIASCSYTRELMLRHGIPEEKVALIYYAVDQSRHDPAIANGARVRAELGIAPETPVIGKVAYFYPPGRRTAMLPPLLRGRGIKGHDVLIRAVPRVLRSFPDAKFVLVGRGWGPNGPTYEQELKILVNDLGVGSSVLFPGERNDVPDVLASFDVSVHCCLSDNLGGTVETLLMAKPLVVSNIGGFADTVRHEETGLVVPVDDPEALAAAIVRLLRDRALGARLGGNGRRRMLERFTLARTVEDLERLFVANPARARDRYRIGVGTARAIVLPIVLAPVAFRVQRGLRKHGFTIRGFVRQRMEHAIRRWAAAIFARVRTSKSA